MISQKLSILISHDPTSRFHISCISWFHQLNSYDPLCMAMYLWSWINVCTTCIHCLKVPCVNVYRMTPTVHFKTKKGRKIIKVETLNSHSAVSNWTWYLVFGIPTVLSLFGEKNYSSLLLTKTMTDELNFTFNFGQSKTNL